MAEDCIIIRDLELSCIIGDLPHERRVPQTVRLNITLYGDWRRAGQTDDLADTVDYLEIRNRVAEHVVASRYRLLERLAEAVATLCLKPARVTRVAVTVDKPGALENSRSVAVTIHRSA